MRLIVLLALGSLACDGEATDGNVQRSEADSAEAVVGEARAAIERGPATATEGEVASAGIEVVHGWHLLLGPCAHLLYYGRPSRG